MAVSVFKFELSSPQDISGLETLVASGALVPDQIVAIIGKTEGNGGVNDFSRTLADQTYRRALLRLGTRDEPSVAAIPMVWSGGCDGVITPHVNIFCRDGVTGSPDKSRLAIGGAISEEILPEDIGRPAMVEKIAAAVRAAMKDAGITDPKDVHFVQAKTPLLTVASAADAARRGQTVACKVQESSGIANGTGALGIAVGLGEIAMPEPAQICRDLSLYSSVASSSSGIEFSRAQIVLLGNRPGAGGKLRVGHALMDDMLDMDGVYAAIRNAGLALPDRPKAEDLKGRLVTLFIKCEPNRDAKLRGRRQVMFNDSDIPYHRHAKAAVGGAVTAATGDPAVFISVDAMHSGPHGSGPCVAIVDMEIMILKLRPITKEEFAPFGQVLSWKPGDGLRNNYAAKLHSGRPKAKPNLRIQRTEHSVLPVAITIIERHPNSSQLFAPLSASPFLVVVFPSDKAGKPVLEKGNAFHVYGDQAINYNSGTWHHCFKAYQRPGTFLMLRWEDGSSDDTEFLPLSETITVTD